jgi:ABC-2 type transport system permease protein
MAGKGPDVQLTFDGTDSNTTQVVMGYANTIINKYQLDVAQQEAESRGSITDIPKIDLRDRAWFNGNLISRNYYLPGVIASIVTMMSLMLSSMAIVKEKEIGTMEQLIVSPLEPIELIIGKLLPFGIIALVQIILITTLGVGWFHIPLRGNLLLLLFASCIYLFTTLGIGLFISTISSTQQEAMMSIFLFYMPTTLLSGFAYPIANMPAIIRWFTFFNPLRYFMVIIRSIFLKGVGIDILWDQILALLVMGAVVITLSAAQFRKRLG